MCLGGVPKYLEQIDPKQSLEKNLNRLCFTANGFFVQEYETLFKEQFRSSRIYEPIVEALSQSSASLSELARKVGGAKGGGFRGQIHNLVQAQFVREYRPVQLRKQTSKTLRFKLVDPFLLFYFRYIHANRNLILRNRGENLFRAIAGSTIAQYYGYAFERLGEDAIAEILRQMDIRLVDILRMGPYFQQRTTLNRGLQIDWLIVRRDHVWTLLEFKYSNAAIGREVIDQVKQKVERLSVPDSITVEPVLIAANGVTRSVVREGFFHYIITLQDLYATETER